MAAASFARPTFAGVAYRYDVQIRARNTAMWQTEAAEVSNDVNEAGASCAVERTIATGRSGVVATESAAAASDKYSNE